MTLLFAILLLSTAAVVCAGTAIYLRIRRHPKAAEVPGQDQSMNEIDHGRESR